MVAAIQKCRAWLPPLSIRMWLLQQHLLLLLVWLCHNDNTTHVEALVTPTPVSTLLSQHASTIAQLRQVCVERDVDVSFLPYSNDLFFLRYCMASCDKKGSDSSNTSPETLLNQSLDWRLGMGKNICGVAAAAVEQALSSSKWDNTVVLYSAPHSTAISTYITPQNCLTTTTMATPTGDTPDLVYCIRAGGIDDVGLMQAVSVPQLVEFFLYVKEINALVCDWRSRTSDQLLYTITCNDLSGVKLLGGSADFRQALSQSSKLAATVYPSSYTGPTLLLNLPPLLAALVQLFTPLFPESVKARLKFSQGLLRGVTDLTKVATTSTAPERADFARQLDTLLQGK
jgi:hypothetical protein